MKLKGRTRRIKARAYDSIYRRNTFPPRLKKRDLRRERWKRGKLMELVPLVGNRCWHLRPVPTGQGIIHNGRKP